MNQSDTEETSHPEEDASTAEDGAITLETARKEEGVASALGTIQEDIDIRVLVQGADTTIDTITQDLQADLDLVPVTRDLLEEATKEEMTKMTQEVLVLENQEAKARIIIPFLRKKII